MDTLSTVLTSSGAVLALGIGYKIWVNIKGKRLISFCCGRKLEVGVDVRDIPHSPVEPEKKSHPPPHPVGGKHGQSRHVFAPKERKHREGSESEVSGQKHPHPTSEEADTVPVSSGSASSGPKEYWNEKGFPSETRLSLLHHASK